MPIHEYKCKKCNSRFEVLQKIKDTPLQQCRHCGGPLEKLISSPAIQFKGSGWYVTDYAQKSAPSPKEKTKKKTEASKQPETKTPPTSTPAG